MTFLKPKGLRGFTTLLALAVPFSGDLQQDATASFGPQHHTIAVAFGNNMKRVSNETHQGQLVELLGSAERANARWILNNTDLLTTLNGVYDALLLLRSEQHWPRRRVESGRRLEVRPEEQAIQSGKGDERRAALLHLVDKPPVAVDLGG